MPPPLSKSQGEQLAPNDLTCHLLAAVGNATLPLFCPLVECGITILKRYITKKGADNLERLQCTAADPQSWRIPNKTGFQPLSLAGSPTRRAFNHSVVEDPQQGGLSTTQSCRVPNKTGFQPLQLCRQHLGFNLFYRVVVVVCWLLNVPATG